MLPIPIKRKLQDLNFPTSWQAVLFRNYGIVPTKNLAAVLDCHEKIVEAEASRLGLEKREVDESWLKFGYITIIRNNWFLLPYSQIMQLISFSEKRLEFCLKEEDFLIAKLGDKPDVEEVVYKPLTLKEIFETNQISKILQELNCITENKPFDFFSLGSVNQMFSVGQTNRNMIVHGYLTPCGDALMEQSETYLPDSLLAQYQQQGINGLWMHGVLSALSPYPFRMELSSGYQKRREELKRLIKRAGKFGIKIYLYFNEPRYLPLDCFDLYTHLIGHQEKGEVGIIASLCLSQQETQEYLYKAFKDFLSDVKNLGGIITITMSEYLTHCHSHRNCNCVSCRDITLPISASRANNIIMRAIKDSRANTELLANLWGWSYLYGWTKQEIQEGIRLLDKDISIICVSEYGLALNKGGVEAKLIDYSISNPGPSEESRMILEYAQKHGHKIYAKIQVNNSWECSCVPYLPVFDLIYEHMENLSKVGVKDYMLCWTLGGYPSPCLNLAAAKTQEMSLEQWYKNYFGKEAEKIHAGVKMICEGFESYPFTVNSLYFSPCSLGPANLWSLSSDQKTSTMVCFSYDDYESWIHPYPIDIYLKLYKDMLNKWEEGLSILKEAQKTAAVKELILMAESAYIHFKSSYNHTLYAIYKRDIKNNCEKLMNVIIEEKENAKCLISLMAKDSRIGFEASNHYFYTQNILKEKVINLEKIETELRP